MKLFILRHGEAERQITSDEARNLTATGRTNVAAVANVSALELQTVQQIWVSPLLRAQQTAEIVCAQFEKNGLHIDRQTLELIVPEASPFLLFDAIQAAQIESLLLVSHQPLVGHFIDLFCGSYQGFHEMNTSSMACIEYDKAEPKAGTLCWLRHAYV